MYYPLYATCSSCLINTRVKNKQTQYFPSELKWRKSIKSHKMEMLKYHCLIVLKLVLSTCVNVISIETMNPYASTARGTNFTVLQTKESVINQK